MYRQQQQQSSSIRTNLQYSPTSDSEETLEEKVDDGKEAKKSPSTPQKPSNPVSTLTPTTQLSILQSIDSRQVQPPPQDTNFSSIESFLSPLLGTKYVSSSVTKPSTRIKSIQLKLEELHPPEDLKALFKNVFPSSSWPPPSLPGDIKKRTPSFLAAFHLATKANEFSIYQAREASPSTRSSKRSKTS